MKSERTFEVVVGVDQTGARKNQSRAKALPTALLILDNKKKMHNWHLRPSLELRDFNKSSLLQLIKENFKETEWSKVLIVADCVLGLPKQVVGRKPPYRLLTSLMEAAARFEGVGLKAGEDFFNEHLPVADKLDDKALLREQEKFLKCLSVFKNKPFQRNVQTGTYRIWGDLGQNKEYQNFNIWPYEDSPDKVYLCEGYPAHAKEIVEREGANKIEGFSSLKCVSQDHKDASYLAILGALFFNPSHEIKNKNEGCILIGNKQAQGLEKR